MTNLWAEQLCKSSIWTKKIYKNFKIIQPHTNPVIALSRCVVVVLLLKQKQKWNTFNFYKSMFHVVYKKYQVTEL